MLIWFLAIFVFSFFLALRSMRDFNIPKEIKQLITAGKIKGSIIFFKDKTRHYHK